MCFWTGVSGTYVVAKKTWCFVIREREKSKLPRTQINRQVRKGEENRQTPPQSAPLPMRHVRSRGAATFHHMHHCSRVCCHLPTFGPRLWVTLSRSTCALLLCICALRCVDGAKDSGRPSRDREASRYGRQKRLEKSLLKTWIVRASL